MLIKSYGLFWSAEEIDWYPGNGAKGAFRLLGRRGATAANLELADFRGQQGIYILYGNFGPYYVGLTRKQGLGKRLKDHLEDQLAGKWDRFSWFGFCDLLRADRTTGIRPLKALPQVQLGTPANAIGDIEALLIKAMGLKNIKQMNFHRAQEWTQVLEKDASRLLDRTSPAISRG